MTTTAASPGPFTPPTRGGSAFPAGAFPNGNPVAAMVDRCVELSRSVFVMNPDPVDQAELLLRAELPALKAGTMISIDLARPWKLGSADVKREMAREIAAVIESPPSDPSIFLALMTPLLIRGMITGAVDASLQIFHHWTPAFIAPHADTPPLEREVSEYLRPRLNAAANWAASRHSPVAFNEPTVRQSLVTGHFFDKHGMRLSLREAQETIAREPSPDGTPSFRTVIEDLAADAYEIGASNFLL